jgi:outer membrane protein OmpA-like peptidoglycan-associated protein
MLANKKTMLTALFSVSLFIGNAYAINSTTFCDNFQKKEVKSYSLEKTFDYLKHHSDDFTANFCYGIAYASTKKPFTTLENYAKENYIPITYYAKAIKLTKNPAYIAMAYLEIAEYYGNNNGYPATAESRAKTDYYLSLAIENALKANDQELIQNAILKYISYGDPLKLDEYIALGNKYFTSDKDKIIFYSALADKFDNTRDYKKALYYRLEALDLKFKMKMFFDIADTSVLQDEIFKANDYNLTQQAITKLVQIAEYLQKNGQKTQVFNHYTFSYNYLAGNIYDGLGDLLFKINRYNRALEFYKLAYNLYVKSHEIDRAKQELKKIDNTEKAIKANQ